MSYLMRARMIEDTQLLQRMSACAAIKRIPNPEQWVFDNRWDLVIGEDWDTAYGVAWNLRESWDGESKPEPPLPGMDESAITDAMILVAVEGLIPEQGGEGE